MFSLEHFGVVTIQKSFLKVSTQAGTEDRGHHVGGEAEGQDPADDLVRRRLLEMELRQLVGGSDGPMLSPLGKEKNRRFAKRPSFHLC